MLLPRRTLRQLFDGAAIGVAGCKVQLLEIRPLAQQTVDMAHLLEPHRPLGVVYEAQALDDVAGCDIARRQVGVLAERDLLGVGAGRFQFALQPRQGLAGGLRAVAQAVEKLRCKGAVASLLRIGTQDVDILASRNQRQLVGHLVGEHPHVARLGYANSQAAQVFHQHEAQQ